MLLTRYWFPKIRPYINHHLNHHPLIRPYQRKHHHKGHLNFPAAVAWCRIRQRDSSFQASFYPANRKATTSLQDRWQEWCGNGNEMPKLEEYIYIYLYEYDQPKCCFTKRKLSFLFVVWSIFHVTWLSSWGLGRNDSTKSRTDFLWPFSGPLEGF